MNNKPRFWIQLLSVIIILALALWGGKYLLDSKPKAKKKPLEKKALFVQTITPEFGNFATIIQTVGTTTSYQTASVFSEVSGKITSVDSALKPGQFYKKGEKIIQIDPRNYHNSVIASQSKLDQINADILLEKGNQLLAKEELNLSNMNMSDEQKALILRQPQMQKLQASQQEALAQLNRSKDDLQRTTIKAPFNGVIAQVNVTQGSMATSGTPLFTMINTKKFHVIADIPPHTLAYLPINVPNHVTLTPLSKTPTTMKRQGTIKHLLADVDAISKQPKVIVEVLNPMQNNPLFIGDKVNVTIEGKRVHNVYKIPWGVLHNLNHVLVNVDNKLTMKPVTIVYKNPDALFVTGLEATDQIITTNIANAVEGVRLKTKVIP
jgi:RND family efflux transporter MFP subunit